MTRIFNLLALSALAASLLTVSAEAMGDRDGAEGKGTVLVAGASGRSGRYVMEQLQEQGYLPRGMTRNIERAAKNVPGDYEWVQGDAKDPSTLMAANQTHYFRR